MSDEADKKKSVESDNAKHLIDLMFEYAPSYVQGEKQAGKLTVIRYPRLKLPVEILESGEVLFLREKDKNE